MDRLCFCIAALVVIIYCYDYKYWTLLNSIFVVDKYIYWYTTFRNSFSLKSIDANLHTRSSYQICPCTNSKMCRRITSKVAKEIFTFALKSNQSVWSNFDWNRITTIAIISNDYDPELMCYAHQRGARIVILDTMSVENITNPNLRKEWIQQKIKLVQELFLDGINLDFEDPVENESEEQKALTSWVQETRDEFSKVLPGSQVTFDVPWAPSCIDKRCYDILKISKAADFLFIMAYDEQSQIFGKCIAQGNSPFYQTRAGIRRYLQMGIPADKLVLGLPWYGYSYRCLSINKDNICSIEHVSFRDVNCSDAAGSQIPLGEIQQILKTSSTGRLWNATEQTPYFNYEVNGQTFQMRYDDAESLKLKYKLSKIYRLHGAGMWNAVHLDYRNTKEAEEARSKVWDSLPKYVRNFRR